MADWNKKPEFQDEDEKIKQETVNKIIIDTVDYTESRCKRRFRKWLAETVMVVSGISAVIYMICDIIERMKVLPTEPYREMNELDLIFAVITVLSVAIADCVRQRNE